MTDGGRGALTFPRSHEGGVHILGEADKIGAVSGHGLEEEGGTLEECVGTGHRTHGELNEADGPLFKIKDDPRLTRTGRLIRRLSLDELPQIIKEALRDYWGGPKLTNSPLLRLRVVERALAEHDGNTANALRAVLREAVERIRPEGQRKFTAEWLLYNILELKFLQGQKVRDVAVRLAVSEADLYRKQRVALEELAQSMLEMEREAGGLPPP